MKVIRDTDAGKFLAFSAFSALAPGASRPKWTKDLAQAALYTDEGAIQAIKRLNVVLPLDTPVRLRAVDAVDFFCSPVMDASLYARDRV